MFETGARSLGEVLQVGGRAGSDCKPSKVAVLYDKNRALRATQDGDRYSTADGCGVFKLWTEQNTCRRLTLERFARGCRDEATCSGRGPENKRCKKLWQYLSPRFRSSRKTDLWDGAFQKALNNSIILLGSRKLELHRKFAAKLSKRSATRRLACGCCTKMAVFHILSDSA